MTGIDAYFLTNMQFFTVSTSGDKRRFTRLRGVRWLAPAGADADAVNAVVTHLGLNLL